MYYLITVACYGSHMHGEDPQAVDRLHNQPGSRHVEIEEKRAKMERHLMDQVPYMMDGRRRTLVKEAMQEVCAFRGWQLAACHVRTNHVHVVGDAEAALEKVMSDLKAYASRRLNEAGLDARERKRWARHGSTRWLWTKEEVDAAIVYVVGGQGGPMAVFERTPRS